MKFKGKCKVMDLEENIPMEQYRTGANWLESSSAEKDLKSLSRQQGKDEPVHALAAKTTNGILGQQNTHTVKGNDSSSLCCIYVATEYLTYSGAPQYKTDVGMLEKIQWRATKIRDTWQETR